MLTALAPLKWWILRHYFWPIVFTLAVTFVVLTGLLYRLILLFPLRSTGRKLTHVDHQFSSPEAFHPMRVDGGQTRAAA